MVPKRAKGIALGCFAAAWLVAPASATAGTFHAAPAPTGAMDCSSVGDACSIATAVTMANAPDLVLLEAGNYSLGAALNVSTGETVQPRLAGVRPRLTEATGVTVGVSGGSTLIGVEIAATDAGSSRALDVIDAGSIAQRIRVTASTNVVLPVQLRDGGLLSDSVVTNSTNGGVGVVFGGTAGTLRNTTVYATGTNSLGAAANGNFTAPGMNLLPQIRNSVLRGTQFDISASDAGTDLVTVNVSHSNYVTTTPATGGASVNGSGGGNQSSAPLFANPAAGDFTQLAGSPTIDAGSPTALVSPLDFSGKPRVLGSLVDIGADEYLPLTAVPVQTSTPPGTPGSAPKAKKCKRKGKAGKKTSAAAKKCKKRKKR